MLRTAYTLAAAFAAAFLAYAFATQNPLQTDLAALLPQEHQPDALVQAADALNEQQLNGQVVLLAGSTEAEKAFQTASEIASLWRKSGVFAAVDSEVSPDLAALRSDTAKLGLATLPERERDLLMNNPQAYFRERAEAVVNPFAAPSLLPPDEDWPGFGRFVLQSAAPQSRLQWHADSGMLFTEDGQGKTWVWLRGRLPDNGGLAGGGEGLLSLLQQSRALAAANGAETLSAGGAVFAAASKAAAERESRIMGTAGLLLTFALLLGVFRTARVFWLLLPLSAGMLAGLAAAVAVFGEVHILTVVIGTSLVGMLVDFPLHWLAPSVFGRRQAQQVGAAFSDGLWQPAAAMRQVLPTFAVSLLITVSGYALLWFTPLPVLRQTAVFSGFALLGAFGATVLWLPPLFGRYRGGNTPFAVWVEKLYEQAGRLKAHRRKAAAALLVLAAAGLWRSGWHDDIREWVSIPAPMLAEAQQIGELSGMEFGGRYLLVEAQSQDGLLQKSAEAERRLQTLVAEGGLEGVQSLNRWLMPQSGQQALKARLRDLAGQPETWAAMREIGVPDAVMAQALLQAADTPAASLSDGLGSALAEAWRPLYVGEVAPQRFAAVIRLNGLKDADAAKAALNGLEGVHWADKRAHLNDLFQHTRNQAAWLKLASYALAWLLLWRMFGAKRGMQVLAVPLAAAVCTVAVLGWLGLPVSLFAMFGLLLVSAIGADYAVYAVAAKHTAQARLGGLLLAALTTGISFGLLALSSTPAVAAFGIAVASGVVFNLLFASLLLGADTHKARRGV